MNESRIPDYLDHTFDGMLMWFAEMSVRGLLFHPEDNPEDIIHIADDSPLFDESECRKLNGILGNMYEEFGDQVCEAAYPVFMKLVGQRLDA